jgi:membrane protein implicated in regulation of membrane protease activity
MRTKLIMAIVTVLDLAAVAVGIFLILLLGGWTAAGIMVGLAGLLLLAHRSARAGRTAQGSRPVRPWGRPVGPG